MKKIKNYFLIVIFSIISFIAGLTISEAKANINPLGDIQSSDIGHHAGVRTQTIYVDGQRYVVFTSGYSSMFVIKK